jgi:peptidoglycan/LPS O-acetylase OafA/YrhL
LKLKSLELLNENKRNSSIDFYRALAIISVVLFHFNKELPLGYIGVDLFFVISGLLIGGILFKSFYSLKGISFGQFFISRGFKIWPSFYFFLIAGSLLARFFYSEKHPDQIIPFNDLGRYLFFYQNYTGAPFHWSFDHVWSLCVEEHFYILFPISLILLRKLKTPYSYSLLIISCLIMLGFFSKILMQYYSHGQDTYSATNNRLDAFGWGILLSWILLKSPETLANKKSNIFLTIFGLLGFVATIIIFVNTQSIFFSKVIFHSLLPLFFTLILAGCYYVNFSRFIVLRFIAYYSYNWYLWHPVLVIYITDMFGVGLISLFFYLVVSFAIAVASTILIEEPFLELRKKVLLKFFHD